MQTNERSPPPLNDPTPCPCSGCFQRKDFNDESLVPHPRELYSHNRLLGFGSQITMLPFAPIPTSPPSLFAPHNLHRASYPRAVFAPDGLYNLAGVQDMPKRSSLRESHLVQSHPLPPITDLGLTHPVDIGSNMAVQFHTRNHGACVQYSLLNSLRDWNDTLRASSTWEVLSAFTSHRNSVSQRRRSKSGFRIGEFDGESKYLVQL
ncbi:hypothetical protein OS493_031025 [Desmophyllum pertusum]|uniref:Uncharacterized protein n=1 Tax=Desmophyllum pertusum TaxID=174260 RepID=A0A9X0CV11_9CNID|nr:hypothetical protein OS493_031025 [Desmophyllum pertusum]